MTDHKPTHLTSQQELELHVEAMRSHVPADANTALAAAVAALPQLERLRKRHKWLSRVWVLGAILATVVVLIAPESVVHGVIALAIFFAAVWASAVARRRTPRPDASSRELMEIASGGPLPLPLDAATYESMTEMVRSHPQFAPIVANWLSASSVDRLTTMEFQLLKHGVDLAHRIAEVQRRREGADALQRMATDLTAQHRR